MEIEEIKQITSGIEGWLTDTEGESLYCLSKKCKRENSIVEIGSYKGKSTIWLSCGSKDGNQSKIYAIDAGHSAGGVKELQNNIKKYNLDDTARILCMWSEEAAQTFNKSVGLIFIDGDHEYSAVLRDYELWKPKIIMGGVIIFHDTLPYAGVRKCVNNLLCKAKDLEALGFVDSIIYFKKIEKCSFKIRINNIFFFTVKITCDFFYDLFNEIHFLHFLITLAKKFQKIISK